jgi:hypothetical protein
MELTTPQTRYATAEMCRAHDNPWWHKSRWWVAWGTTGMIKLLTAPIRSIVRFPLVQLAFVVVLITFLQAADDKSVLGQLFTVLDALVDSTVRLISSIFNVKSFTKEAW